jgi:hypothetical protein
MCSVYAAASNTSHTHTHYRAHSNLLLTIQTAASQRLITRRLLTQREQQHADNLAAAATQAAAVLAQERSQAAAALAHERSQRLAESAAADYLLIAYQELELSFLQVPVKAKHALVCTALLTAASGHTDTSDGVTAVQLLAAVKAAAAAERATTLAAAAAAAAAAVAVAAVGDEHAGHRRSSSNGSLSAIGGALLGVTAGVASTVNGVVNMLPADAAKAVHSAAEATAEAFMAGARRANSGECFYRILST